MKQRVHARGAGQELLLFLLADGLEARGDLDDIHKSINYPSMYCSSVQATGCRQSEIWAKGTIDVTGLGVVLT